MGVEGVLFGVEGWQGNWDSSPKGGYLEAGYAGQSRYSCGAGRWVDAVHTGAVQEGLSTSQGPYASLLSSASSNSSQASPGPRWC